MTKLLAVAYAITIEDQSSTGTIEGQSLRRPPVCIPYVVIDRIIDSKREPMLVSEKVDTDLRRFLDDNRERGLPLTFKKVMSAVFRSFPACS